MSGLDNTQERDAWLGHPQAARTLRQVLPSLACEAFQVLFDRVCSPDGQWSSGKSPYGFDSNDLSVVLPFRGQRCRGAVATGSADSAVCRVLGIDDCDVARDALGEFLNTFLSLCSAHRTFRQLFGSVTGGSPAMTVWDAGGASGLVVSGALVAKGGRLPVTFSVGPLAGSSTKGVRGSQTTRVSLRTMMRHIRRELACSAVDCYTSLFECECLSPAEWIVRGPYDRAPVFDFSAGQRAVSEQCVCEVVVGASQLSVDATGAGLAAECACADVLGEFANTFMATLMDIPEFSELTGSAVPSPPESPFPSRFPAQSTVARGKVVSGRVSLDIAIAVYLRADEHTMERACYASR